MTATRRICAQALAVVLLALIWAAGARAAPPGREMPSLAVAVAADLSLHAGRTRLTVTLLKKIEASSFVLERPERAIIDLPEVNFQLAPETGRRHLGLVKSFRCGLIAPGRSRIVVDLASPAVPVRTETVIGTDGLPRLVVEFARSDRQGFQRAAQVGDGNPTIRVTGSIEENRGRDRRPVLVLDAGHGGVDPGATAISGEAEKDIVLAFTERLRDTLAASGRYRIVMTRDHDLFVPLDERVRRGRAAGADLFVSIHADSIASPAISGATIYTGAERATDLESAVLAERENASDATAGLPGPAEPADVSDILQDLTSRETRGLSHRFAGQLFGELNPAIRFSARPHREAGFRVLRASDMPSVLVELGYVSNAQDAESLRSEGWRRRTAGAMAKAIDRFFALRLAGAATAPVSP